MKKIGGYLVAVATMGTISGLAVSMGTHILMGMGVMSLFWAGMFAPMLGGE
jgi:hypothetical protein